MINMSYRDRIPFKIPYLRLCVYCEADLADTWDHVIPYSKGGPTLLTNLVPACKRCNSLAHDLLFESFEEKRLYVRYRSTLRRKPRKLFGMTPRIFKHKEIIKIQPHVSVLTHSDASPPPIGKWIPASVDNALWLMLGSPRRNREIKVENLAEELNTPVLTFRDVLERRCFLIRDLPCASLAAYNMVAARKRYLNGRK